MAMNQSSFSPTIDEYPRKRLMPVEGAIPHLAGIDMSASASDQLITTHLICAWIGRPFAVGRGGAEWRCEDFELGLIRGAFLSGTVDMRFDESCFSVGMKTDQNS